MVKIIDFHIHPPGPGGMSAKEQEETAAYFRGGAPPNCGKGQPEQVAHTGHGAAPARFRNVQVGLMR